MPNSCDIFCNVIDNYGDIGVCWRLARQLAHEHALHVRLWVDDLASFARICPDVDPLLTGQTCRGVEIRHWSEPFPAVQPARLVIEVFGCRLPPDYIDGMASMRVAPVWINLEYLSAEDWVEGCHRLPSPHPNLPLTKYFFFPGFTRQTGGLLLERDLIARRDAFLGDGERQAGYWRAQGMEPPIAGTLKVSLFAYENAAVAQLFDVWADGTRPVLCLVPEGRILQQVGYYFGDTAPHAGKRYVCGSLAVRVVPFVEQERYDELLWACDLNFVRGEDSCVRAQWAGKPFIWQIYPQHDAVHWDKLEAFLTRYRVALDDEVGNALLAFWREWNAEGNVAAAWPAIASAYGDLAVRARSWADELVPNNLALNLLDFYREVGKMRAFKI